MADLSLINIGNSANDGTGDDLREAFTKVNSNLNLLNIELATLDQTTASNIGGGIEIFADETNNNLAFRSLVAGADIAISIVNDSVKIMNTAAHFTIDDGDTATDLYPYSNILKFNNTGPVDTVSITNNQVNFDTAIQNDSNPILGGNLQGNDFRVIADLQGDLYASDDSSLIIDSESQTFYGNVDGTIQGVDFAPYLSQYDFGSFDNIEVNNIFDLIISTSNVDFGSVSSPSAINLDLGVLS